MKNKIIKSIKKLEEWIEENNYKGYEPFDGLSSIFYPLTFKNPFLERLMQQLVRQSPINIRPLLGIKIQESTKGRGYMAWGYLTLFRMNAQEQYKEKAVKLLNWLDQNKSPQYKYHSWGNHFDFTSRVGKLPKFEPIIVWTSLIGQAFLDAYEIINEKRYLNIAISICDWILNLPIEQTESGSCLSYVTFTQRSIHNSNMLGAAMLARTAKLTGNSKIAIVAKDAIEYSCKRQLSNGAWYYGEEKNLHWIDNFHTGYNLDSLKCYIESTDDDSYKNNLIKGFKYYKEHFFEDNGRPKYYDNRSYPIDIQCASQAIDTLVNFSEFDPSCLNLAQKVANWTIENMQDKSGYFYYRILPIKKVKTPMIHWGQSTIYKAMASLISKME